MTLLSACQSAAIRLVSRKPDTIFSATDPFSLEMQVLANEVAKDIAKSHDWQALVRTHSIAANGTDTVFPLPDDYDRMLLDSEIYDGSNWAWGYCHVTRPNDWLRMKVENFGWITPGAWIMQGNQFEFQPAPATGTAEFVYITKEIVTDNDGAPIPSFTDDGDSFVLSERLLSLGIIWKWREMKRMESSTDEANFVKAFSEIAGKDGGPKIIRKGQNRSYRNSHVAWPWPLGGL